MQGEISIFGNNYLKLINDIHLLFQISDHVGADLHYLCFIVYILTVVGLCVTQL